MHPKKPGVTGRIYHEDLQLYDSPLLTILLDLCALLLIAISQINFHDEKTLIAIFAPVRKRVILK